MPDRPLISGAITYFPRDTLPPFLQTIAAILPLASVVDLLRFPLGLPPFWPLQLLWLVGLTVVFAWMAVRKIYPKLVQ